MHYSRRPSLENTEINGDLRSSYDSLRDSKTSKTHSKSILKGGEIIYMQIQNNDHLKKAAQNKIYNDVFK